MIMYVLNHRTIVNSVLLQKYCLCRIHTNSKNEMWALAFSKNVSQRKGTLYTLKCHMQLCRSAVLMV
jgi:hypothetical protein